MRDFDNLSGLKSIAYYRNLNLKRAAKKFGLNPFPFIALVISACGGGGSNNTVNSSSENQNNSVTNLNTVDQENNSGIDTSTQDLEADAEGESLSGGFSFGGFGATSLPAAGNTLSIYRVGADYASTSYSGISQVNGDAHFTVADAPSNSCK